MRGTYLGRSGTSVLYIGCMVPIWGGAVRVLYIGCMLPVWGVAVRLSYIQDAWCLKVKAKIAISDNPISFCNVITLKMETTGYSETMVW